MTKEPLCAAYVKYNYGGEAAYKKSSFYENELYPCGSMGSIIRVDGCMDLSAEKGRHWNCTYCRKQSDACIDGHFYRMV